MSPAVQLPATDAILAIQIAKWVASRLWMPDHLDVGIKGLVWSCSDLKSTTINLSPEMCSHESLLGQKLFLSLTAWLLCAIDAQHSTSCYTALQVLTAYEGTTSDVSCNDCCPLIRSAALPTDASDLFMQYLLQALTTAALVLRSVGRTFYLD